MLSPEADGPQESSEGRAATRSAIEIGAILNKSSTDLREDLIIIVGYGLGEVFVSRAVAGVCEVGDGIFGEAGGEAESAGLRRGAERGARGGE